jgi:hypothetical protein
MSTKIGYYCEACAIYTEAGEDPQACAACILDEYENAILFI